MGAVGYSKVGSSVAVRLAQDGADVAIHGNEGTDKAAAALCEEIQALGAAATWVTCDPTSPAEVAAMCDEVAGSLGGIDALIGTASVVPGGALLDAATSTWRETLLTNLKAPFLVGRAAARIMIDAGRPGKILFLSSHAARIGIAGLGVYASSQAGLGGLVRTMALELADFDIAVNLLSVGSMREDPGYPDTSGVNSGAPLLQEWSGGKGTALGRPNGEAPASLPLRGGVSIDEVADTVSHLISSRGDYSTGQVVDMTRGQIIGR